MANDLYPKYGNQLEKDSHDNSANVTVKRSGLYGWNTSTLQWERITSSGGTPSVNVNALAAIYNGKTTVTTAGTRVSLAASQAITSVTIKALAANTGIIYVGNSTVASSNGFALAAGESISMDITNLNTISIDSSVNGEGVTYLAIG